MARQVQPLPELRKKPAGDEAGVLGRTEPSGRKGLINVYYPLPPSAFLIVSSYIFVNHHNIKLAIDDWSVEDVTIWLTSIELDVYNHTFIEYQVDGSMLKILTAEDLLHRLHIKKLGHRKRLQRLLKERITSG